MSRVRHVFNYWCYLSVTSTDKFGRAYKLQVSSSIGKLLTVELPFTLEFDITQSTLSSANVCQIRIFNLSQENRELIRHNVTDYGEPFQTVSLAAGYGSNLPTIFSGNVSSAWSVREGVNFITQIECYDGGVDFITGRFGQSFAAGAFSEKTIVTTLASSLPSATLGAVGNYDTTLITRGNAHSGNTMQILNDITSSSGGSVFIDKGKVYVLKTNEYVLDPNGISIITSASGLLGTPMLERTRTVFDMVFEPQLYVGRAVILDSITANNFNGLYKIVGVKHRGTISAAVCGAVITTGEFFYNNPLVGVPPA